MAVYVRRLAAWVALCAATTAHATEYAAHTLARPEGERR